VVQIGIQLVDRLHALHTTDYIHLDLKPENIVLGSSDYSSLESSNIYLIDFGMASKYKTETGAHVK